jgi:hypothetical protein
MQFLAIEKIVGIVAKFLCTILTHLLVDSEKVDDILIQYLATNREIGV